MGPPNASTSGRPLPEVTSACSTRSGFHDSWCRCERTELASALAAPRLERAIGVLYLPQSERASHYFHARLPEQFDFVLHVDETGAVEPLE